jgi:hypothetical protein
MMADVDDRGPVFELRVWAEGVVTTNDEDTEPEPPETDEDDQPQEAS